ncbi:MAG: 50S ribosomal protein L10, partial [Candidatus Omnitrophota bacterium]
MEKTALKPGRLLKDRILTEYYDRVNDSSFIFVTDFKSVSNKDLEELKKKLREASSKYVVIKNSLGKIALEKSELGNMSQFVSGTCGLSYGTGDAVSISKILVDFAKKMKEFTLRGGLVEGEVVDEKTIKYLATL